MDLNPAHVRTLREIARHGSFSRAAESLRLSQPAVSLHMRQLEARCGTALLERVEPNVLGMNRLVGTYTEPRR